MAHTYFAVMGGFAFDIGETDVPFLPREWRYRTITPLRVQLVLHFKPSLLPSSNKVEISCHSPSTLVHQSIIISTTFKFNYQSFGVKCLRKLAMRVVSLTFW